MSERRFRRDRKQRQVREERRQRTLKRAAIAGGAAFCAGAFAAPAADAATFTVSQLGDTDPGSLREAVQDANAADGPDQIVFQSGLTGQMDLTSGDIEILEAVDIQGPGASAVTISGGENQRIFRIETDTFGEAVSISGLTLTDGFTPDSGGAIQNINAALTLSDSTVTDSYAGADEGFGGGIATGGPTIVEGSTISGNFVSTSDPKYGWGGGIAVTYDGSLVVRDTTVAGNGAAIGGGGVGFYRIDNDEQGQNRIERSRITGNGASLGGGVGIGYMNNGASPVRIDSTLIDSGGAKYGGGFGTFQAVGANTYVTNSTISGNQADTGGGVFHAATWYEGCCPVGRELYLTGVTIAGNEADVGGGIARETNTYSTVQLTNSIVADNEATDAPDIASEDPHPADEVAARYSLIETPGSPFTDQGRNITGKDPQLAGLDANGGPTPTHMPQLTSPVLDKGLSSGLTADQRGEPRPFDIQGIASSPGGDGADMGAVEQSRPAAPAPPAKKKKKCKKKKNGKAAAAAKKCKKKKKK